MKSKRIVISNGGYKFHLAPLSVEMYRAGILAGFLTAGWPRGWQKWVAKRFPNSKAWKRFLDRAEGIPEEIVYSFGLTEIFFQGADVLVRRWSQTWQQKLHRVGFWFYSRKAAKVVGKIKPDIYHYRNCYGLKSVEIAKQKGAVCLCDHSIAHPYFVQWLETNRGTWPTRDDLQKIPSSLMPMQQAMAIDLGLADHTLVNSDFVKQTCIEAGMEAEKVHVIYLGVDDAFFQMLDSNASAEKVSPSTILFAGGWQRRKGVDTLIEALMGSDFTWNIEIAGGIKTEVHSIPNMTEFLKSESVNYLGVLSRSDLAVTMKRHRIFVFPSYCEGSARVIFEAMAAGCYIITTPNSGSIVADGIHGKIVNCGDVSGMREAIEYALSNLVEIEKIGRNNAALVAKEYRQRDYGLKVRALYESL
ncbi:MAG: glycosyltransferase [Sphingobacteriales bacterium]|nr:MAG: glycosyltransferase [Sphingobacteriales bacterium]